MYLLYRASTRSYFEMVYCGADAIAEVDATYEVPK